MSEMVERVAARLWKADSEDAGVPASIALGRTLEAFADQSEDTRARWRKFARAAIEAMREPTDAMKVAGCKEDDILGELVDWRGNACTTRDAVSNVFTAMIDAALSEVEG